MLSTTRPVSLSITTGGIVVISKIYYSMNQPGALTLNCFLSYVMSDSLSMLRGWVIFCNITPGALTLNTVK